MAALACVVVFCTVYALTMPAITMEGTTFCGKDEHTHTAECGDKTLTCGFVENAGHAHTDVCQAGGTMLTCGLEESAGHTHTELCTRTEHKTLTCTLPEAGHTHTDTCYTIDSVVTCGLTETDGHAHSAGCYSTQSVLVCTETESTGHSHSAECSTTTLICTNTDEGHSHDSACYNTNFTCGLTEGEGQHTHTTACYNSQNTLTCTLEVSTPHTHTADCCTEQKTLSCTLAETGPHTHGESCYDITYTYDCGLTEGAGHTHSTSCYSEVAPNSCPIPESAGHTHDDTCYTLSGSCTLEEHAHTLICYSDPDADVEDAGVWNKTFAHVTITGNWGEDLVAIAKTQLGYAESTKNYEVNPDSTLRGYTRYGEWFGEPYGNWNTMFISFCLFEADIPDGTMPFDFFPDKWIAKLSSEGLYASAAEYLPKAGDIVFFRTAESAAAASAAIVESEEDGVLTVIAGDVNGKVDRVQYAAGDSLILGYGVMPENPDLAPPMLLMASPMMLLSAANSGGEYDLGPYFTGITGTGTVLIGNELFTQLSMGFTISADNAKAERNYYFELPATLEIKDSLINHGDYEVYETGTTNLAFKFHFERDGDGTYTVHVDFDDDYLNATQSGTNIINTLRFNCSFDSSVQSTDGSVHVQFTDDDWLDIPGSDITSSYNLNVQKQESYDDNTKKISYTVNVSSPLGTPGTIAFSDAIRYFSNTGTLGQPQNLTVQRNDGTPISVTPTYTQNNQGGYNVNMTLPQLSAGQSYAVTYEVPVNGLSGDEYTVNAVNEVTTTSTGGNTTVTGTDTASSWYQKKKNPKVVKSGSFESGYVQWQIKVNPDGFNNPSAAIDISNKTLTDAQFANVTSSVNGKDFYITRGYSTEATEGVDYNFVYDAAGKVTGIKFLPDSTTGENKNMYVVSFRSAQDTTAYGDQPQTYTNTAEFDGDRDTATIHSTGGSIGKYAKTHSQNPDGTYEIEWRVDVKIPGGGVAPGTVFEDYIQIPDTVNGGDIISGDHYMTAAQWTDLQTDLTAKFGSQFTITPVPLPSDSTKIIGYRIAVTGNTNALVGGADFNYTYNTTAEMNGATMKTFVNTITDGNKTIRADEPISTGMKKYHVGYATINAGNGVLDTDFNQPNYYQSSSLYLDYDSDKDLVIPWIVEIQKVSGTHNYTITDTLPSELELLGIKVMGDVGDIWWPAKWKLEDTTETFFPVVNGAISGQLSASYRPTIITGTVNGNVVTVSLDSPGYISSLFQYGTKLSVIFYTRIKTSAWPAEGTVNFTLDNDASFTHDGIDGGSADSTITVQGNRVAKNVEKLSNWNGNTHIASYTVDINSQAKNLAVSATQDPTTLDLTDTLTYPSDVTAIPVSVVLEQETPLGSGNWTRLNVGWTVTKGSDTSGNNTSTIAMTIPDSAHLRLTYSYQINLNGVARGFKIGNKVSIGNESPDNSQSEVETQDTDFDAGGSSEHQRRGKYILQKVDEDTGDALAGAIFTTYKWNGTDWVTTGMTYTTAIDSDGVAKITVSPLDKLNGADVYQADTAYCIVETSAPTGYILPQNPDRIYFWFSDTLTAPASAPSDFMTKAFDIAENSKSIVMDNKANPAYSLPNTGGAGSTTYLTAGGLFMVLTAVIGFGRRRRRKGAKA